MTHVTPEIGRRDFLRGMAVGSAVVTLPAFLAGCGIHRATILAEPTPEDPFLQWFGIDPPIISQVMSELTANGASMADVYFQHRRVNSLGMEDGVLSGANSEILQGVGLRVVIDGVTGYAWTEELTLASMLAAARVAAAIAATTARGSPVAAPQAFNPAKGGELYRIDVPWADIGIARKLPVLQRVDRRARAADPAVENVSVYWQDVDERIMIATLDGDLVTDHRPMTRLSAQVRATRAKETQSGFANIAARAGLSWYTDERVDRMVAEAVERTLILFESGSPPAGEMPVILAAGTGGILLHEAIGHALEADFNRSGLSPYADRMGEKVAEPIVTVVDQGTIPRERGALNYDDEGQPTGRTAMVENGILRSLLHDRVSATHYNVAPTGSGRRESYRFAPMPRMTCTFMEGGPHTRDEIIAAVDDGIIAETFMNGHVHLGAGDYRFFVKNGWRVEKGKVTAPLKNLRIVGNGPESLRRITMVANDARFDTGGWTCGKKGQQVPVSEGIPTVLVSGMSVAGKDVG